MPKSEMFRCSMLYLRRLETTLSINGFRSLNDIVQKSQALEWRRVGIRGLSNPKILIMLPLRISAIHNEGNE